MVGKRAFLIERDETIDLKPVLLSITKTTVDVFVNAINWQGVNTRSRLQSKEKKENFDMNLTHLDS